MDKVHKVHKVPVTSRVAVFHLCPRYSNSNGIPIQRLQQTLFPSSRDNPSCACRVSLTEILQALRRPCSRTHSEIPCELVCPRKRQRRLGHVIGCPEFTAVRSLAAMDYIRSPVGCAAFPNSPCGHPKSQGTCCSGHPSWVHLPLERCGRRGRKAEPTNKSRYGACLLTA